MSAVVPHAARAVPRSPAGNTLKAATPRAEAPRSSRQAGGGGGAPRHDTSPPDVLPRPAVPKLRKAAAPAAAKASSPSPAPPTTQSFESPGQSPERGNENGAATLQLLSASFTATVEALLDSEAAARAAMTEAMCHSAETLLALHAHVLVPVLEARSAETATEVRKLTDDLSDAHVQVAELLARAQRTASENRQLKETLAVFEKDLERLGAAQEQGAGSIADLRLELERARGQAATAESERVEAARRCEELSEIVAKLHAALEDVNEKGAGSRRVSSAASQATDSGAAACDGENSDIKSKEGEGERQDEMNAATSTTAAAASALAALERELSLSKQELEFERRRGAALEEQQQRLRGSARDLEELLRERAQAAATQRAELELALDKIAAKESEGIKLGQELRAMTSRVVEMQAASSAAQERARDAEARVVTMEAEVVAARAAAADAAELAENVKRELASSVTKQDWYALAVDSSTALMYPLRTELQQYDSTIQQLLREVAHHVRAAIRAAGGRRRGGSSADRGTRSSTLRRQRAASCVAPPPDASPPPAEPTSDVAPSPRAGPPQRRARGVTVAFNALPGITAESIVSTMLEVAAPSGEVQPPQGNASPTSPGRDGCAIPLGAEEADAGGADGGNSSGDSLATTARTVGSGGTTMTAATATTTSAVLMQQGDATDEITRAMRQLALQASASFMTALQRLESALVAKDFEMRRNVMLKQKCRATLAATEKVVDELRQDFRLKQEEWRANMLHIVERFSEVSGFHFLVEEVFGAKEQVFLVEELRMKLAAERECAACLRRRCTILERHLAEASVEISSAGVSSSRAARERGGRGSSTRPSATAAGDEGGGGWTMHATAAATTPTATISASAVHISSGDSQRQQQQQPSSPTPDIPFAASSFGERVESRGRKGGVGREAKGFLFGSFGSHPDAKIDDAPPALIPIAGTSDATAAARPLFELLGSNSEQLSPPRCDSMSKREERSLAHDPSDRVRQHHHSEAMIALQERVQKMDAVSRYLLELENSATQAENGAFRAHIFAEIESIHSRHSEADPAFIADARDRLRAVAGELRE